MEHTFINLEDKDSSPPGESDKGSCTEGLQIGAAGRNPVEQGAGETPLIGEEHSSPGSISPENLEGLTEKVSTLGLQVTRKNRCGAAKKWTRKTRLTKAPTGVSGCSQPLPAPGRWPQTPQKPGTSGARHGRGVCSAELKSTENKGHPHGPSKQQRPKQGGQLSYTRATWEDVQVTVVCKNYPENQISKENFVDIQWAIGQLVDEFPEDGFTPKLVDSYWAKGAAIMVCHDEMTKDWLATRVPTLVAWEGSRLKIVGLDVLPTYKRVVAWLPDPKDAGQYLLQLRRLNQGLKTRYW